jgi:hypothetical protein
MNAAGVVLGRRFRIQQCDPHVSSNTIREITRNTTNKDFMLVRVVSWIAQVFRPCTASQKLRTCFIGHETQRKVKLGHCSPLVRGKPQW